MDYTRLKRDARFWGVEAGKLLLLAAVCGWLFFGKVIYGLPVLILSPLLIRRDARLYLEKKRRTLEGEFGELVTLLSGQLTAGYSLEQGLLRAVEDFERQAQRDKVLSEELHRMTAGISVNRPVEELLREFGRRSGLGSVRDLAELTATAKLHGGDMVELMLGTVRQLSDQKNLALELKTVQAAKRFEALIMLAMPAGMLVYLKLTNAAYISSLYELAYGRVLMAGALAATAGCGLWIDRILKPPEG